MKKKIICLAISILMLTLSACGANDADGGATPAPGTSSQPPSATPQPSLEPKDKKLSISVCYDFFYIDDAIEKFKKIHPDAEIEVHSFSNDSDKYMTQIAADLMAGTAADIFATTYLDRVKYADNGMMADINKLMENDPDFNQDDYFMNVFEGMKYKGGLYVFPTSFSFETVGVNSTLSEKLTSPFSALSTVTFRQMIDMYLSLENKEGLYLDSNFDISTVVLEDILQFIDSEKKTCHFDSPEFIQLVQEAKAITEPSKVLGNIYSSNAVFPADEMKDSKKYAFSRIFGDNYQYFLNFKEYSFINFIPMANAKGQLSLVPSKEFSINQNAENKEFAWEFLKFLTSMEANTDVFVPSLPVKKDVFDKILTDSLNTYIEWLERDADISPVGEREVVIANAKDQLTGYANMPMVYQYTPYNQIIFENLELFAKGAITAEQLAADLQNKISLALME